MDYFLVAVLSLVGGWAGSFLGSYLKKKGENLATHEDVDKLVAQMRAVTQATKEIESKISNEVWKQQKKWELKREVLFEATRRLSEIDDVLLSLNTVLEPANGMAEESGYAEAKYERTTKWRRASTAFDETRLFIGIVCGTETIEAFDTVGNLTNMIAAKITQKDRSYYKTSMADLLKSLAKARLAIRKELGTDSSA